MSPFWTLTSGFPLPRATVFGAATTRNKPANCGFSPVQPRISTMRANIHHRKPLTHRLPHIPPHQLLAPLVRLHEQPLQLPPLLRPRLVQVEIDHLGRRLCVIDRRAHSEPDNLGDDLARRPTPSGELGEEVDVWLLGAKNGGDGVEQGRDGVLRVRMAVNIVTQTKAQRESTETRTEGATSPTLFSISPLMICPT